MLWTEKDARLDGMLPGGMPVRPQEMPAMNWDLPSPFIHERIAVHTEIDGYGHVNNVVYVAWLDDCAWAHSISRGISPELCRSLNRGMAVWRTQINYLGAALRRRPDRSRDVAGAATTASCASSAASRSAASRTARRCCARCSTTSASTCRPGRAKRMPEEFTRYVVLPEVAAAVAPRPSPTSPASSPR